MTDATTTDEQTFCAVHPDRETGLQCNKCGRYMCIDCAVQTPVGYRCRECVRGIEDRYFTASQRDYAVVFGIGLGLNLLPGVLVAWLNVWLLLVIIIAFPVGGAISEVALRATGRRRGRYSAQVAAAGVALGGLVPLLYILLRFGVLLPDLSVILYAALTATAVFGRFQMRS